MAVLGFSKAVLKAISNIGLFSAEFNIEIFRVIIFKNYFSVLRGDAKISKFKNTCNRPEYSPF